jgi:hypothetical protein
MRRGSSFRVASRRVLLTVRGPEMAAAQSNPGEWGGARCSGPANQSRRSEESSVSAFERSESLA